jgi:hypothetical protein
MAWWGKSTLRFGAVGLTVALGLAAVSCALPTPQGSDTVSTTAVAAPPGQDPGESVAQKLAVLTDEVQETHGGVAGVAVATRHGIVQAGDPGRWHAWSTVKVPIAVAAATAELDGEADVDALIEAAITRSENMPAAELWQLLGGGTSAARQLEELLAPYGEIDALPLATEFSPTPIGLIAWPLAGQAEFSSHLPCLTGAEAVYQAMGEIVPWQVDGLGSIEGMHFKGGWSAEEDVGSRSYTYRQLGALETQDGVIGMAVLVHPEDGEHATAVQMMDDLADGLEEMIEADLIPAATTCTVI